MYNCIKCKNIKMTTRRLNKMPYLWCGKCKSTAIIGVTFKRLIQSDILKDFKRKVLKVASIEQRKCPSCNIEMNTYLYKKKVEIEICRKCQFLFLDEDELEFLKIDTAKYIEENNDISFKRIDRNDSSHSLSLERFFIHTAQVDIKAKKINNYSLITFAIFILSLFLFKYDGDAIELESKNLRYLLIISYFFFKFTPLFETHNTRSNILQTFIITLLGINILNYTVLKQPVVFSLGAIMMASLGSLAYTFSHARVSFLSAIPRLRVSLPLSVYAAIIFIMDIYLYSVSKSISRNIILYHIIGYITGYVFTVSTLNTKKAPK